MLNFSIRRGTWKNIECIEMTGNLASDRFDRHFEKILYTPNWLLVERIAQLLDKCYSKFNTQCGDMHEKKPVGDELKLTGLEHTISQAIQDYFAFTQISAEMWNCRSCPPSLSDVLSFMTPL